MERATDHLLGRLLVVLARLGAKSDAAALPVGCAGRSSARPPGALLPERLGPTAGNLGARLGALRAAAGRGELGGDDLGHERDVGLGAERCVIDGDRTADRSAGPAPSD